MNNDGIEYLEKSIKESEEKLRENKIFIKHLLSMLKIERNKRQQNTNDIFKYKKTIKNLKE